MREPVLLTVPADAEGQRLDAWLAAQESLSLTRSAVQQLLEKGSILQIGALPKKNSRLKAGDSIAVTVPEPVAAEVLPLTTLRLSVFVVTVTL